MAAPMEASMFIMFNMHVHVSMHAYMGHPPHTHTHPNPNPTTHHPPGGTPWFSKNSITFELIKIFQFCLKIWNLWRLLHLWVGVWFGGWVIGWVGYWVGSGQITKNFKNVDPIKIIQFCLKIYDLQRHSHPWVDVWVVGKNLINLGLINIIQVCLKIYDL